MPKILHIEDDPTIRRLVQKVLTDVGYEVVQAVDGLEGANLARREKPDLVLVDINIPQLDGYEVALRLRGEPSDRHVPIVALTATGEPAMSYAVGFDGFIDKPIDVQNFVAEIARYLRGEGIPVPPPPQVKEFYLEEQTQKIVRHLEEKVNELSAANEKLREVDRLRREFYQNISHELSTPLTPIVGYLKLLLDGDLGTLGETQRKALTTINACSVRLRGLIETLLDVTALETGRMQFQESDYDFAEVARRAIGERRPSFAQKGVELIVDVASGPLPARGDAERMTRAIAHVVDNAQKFTPDGGRVLVRARPALGDMIEFDVFDTGEGIPEASLQRIFDAFYQVDGTATRMHGGAGLGLAFVHGVVRAFGGVMRAESPPSETPGGKSYPGARVGFRIPARRAAQEGAPDVK